MYVNRDHYTHILKPDFCKPIQEINLACEDTGVVGIDHIVGNVRQNEMNLWAEYFNKTMGFETFVDFKAGDIGTKFSALLSKVVRTKGSKIRNPINEPFEGMKKSQIEEYINTTAPVCSISPSPRKTSSRPFQHCASTAWHSSGCRTRIMTCSANGMT